jgi:hypothetical protein
MIPEIKLEEFLDFFPIIELPVTLSEDSIIHIQKINKVFPEPVLDTTIRKWEKVEADEFTEYVPCFTAARKEKFVIIVYWKASLTGFEYFAVTLGYDFQLIDRKQISSMLYTGEHVKSSVVHIDEDLTFHVVAGISSRNSDSFDPGKTQAFHFEIDPQGEFIFLKEDNSI